MKNTLLSSAVVTALAAGAVVPATASAQAIAGYRSGDFHNHTTCSDGSTSVKFLTQQSLTFLDWFIQVGHSGSDPRDCRIDDYSGEGAPVLGGTYEDGNGEVTPPGTYWENAVDSIGPDAIKGDIVTTTSWGCSVAGSIDPNPGSSSRRCREMWRWQSLQDFELEDIRAEGLSANKPAFLGLEWVVPGHEHASVAVIAGQYGENINADAQAQFEYCFARNSNDTSQGGGQGWRCEISEENNQRLIQRFENFPEQGPADYNGALDPDSGINISDVGDHVKSVAAVYWMEENYPHASVGAPAHVERQGAFIEDDDEGYNIEHLRDWNEASPRIANGFESQPGHQAQPNRGSYNAGRPSVGAWTFAGTGCYAAAEAARPGERFDGTPLTQDDFGPDGDFPEYDDNEPPEKVTLCRPGVRTAWDAMLSEGRRYWFYGSSDWHDRGTFSPFEPEATNDFFPGEFQKNVFFVRPRNPDDPAQDIVDSLASGNGYVVMGDLIDQLRFTACVGTRCATMGQTLKIQPGDDVTISIAFRDPAGTNHSVYDFANPILEQIGVIEPVNQPTVRVLDLITGTVTSKIDPLVDYAAYTNPLAPETTIRERQWLAEDFAGAGEWKRVKYVMQDVSENKYVRLVGSNIPPATPHARDADGNPLADAERDNVACPQCPPHVLAAGEFVNFDVEAWSDLTFHANPIFIDVGSTSRRLTADARSAAASDGS